MRTDSSSHVAYVLRDVLRYTSDYVAAIERLTDIETLEGDVATAEFELAEAIGHLACCIDEFEGLSRRIDRLSPVAVERSVLRIKQVVLVDQAGRWGWDYLFGKDGMGEARRRIERHRQDREIPFLRANLAWRLIDHSPDETADRLADRARALRLEPLPIAPGEAAEVAGRLRDAWRRTPALGPKIPTALDSETTAVGEALRILSGVVPQIMTPEDALRFIRQCEEDKRRYRARKRRERAEAITRLDESLPKLFSAIARLRGDPFDPEVYSELDHLGLEFRGIWSLWHIAGHPENDPPLPGGTDPNEVDEALERLGWSFGDGRSPCAYEADDLARIEEAALAVRSLAGRLGRDAGPRGIVPESEGVAIPGGSKAKSRKAGGRPPDTDPRVDRKIAEAWATGAYLTHEDLARSFNMSIVDVKRALDRHRKRRGKNSAS